MKKIYFLILSFVLTANFSFAQWTTNGSNIYNSNSGNVGIGTTSPQYSLDVVGTGNFSSNILTTTSGSLFGTVTPSASTGLTEYYYYGLMRQGVVGRFNGMKIYNVANNGNLPASRIGFYTDNTGHTASTEYMTINELGNVGIGTTSPTAKLQMVTSSDVTPTNIGTTNFDSRYFAIGTTGANASALAFSKNSTSGGSAYITSATINLSWDPIGFQAGSYNWYLGGSSTPSVVLTASGNMLLGKATQTNTAYILDANGSVRANAITVNTTGADFVFAPSYKLLTIPELNNFIQKNHHLPEIASAKEMQANGLNLGDNQIKLLQKVEELTLYLIEKDKEIKQQQELAQHQQEIIQSQDEKIQQITKRLEAIEKNLENR